MKTPFFIVSLPRSRSAWLANLFTTDSTLCYHDRMFDKALLRSDRHCGFSCSELFSQYNDIHASFPDAKWLLVKRNPIDALESFKKFQRGVIKSGLEQEFAKRQQFLDSISLMRSVLTVEYNELDTEYVIERIWYHILPYKPWDAARFRLLDELRVEQHFDKAVKNRKELFVWQ